MSNNQTNKQFEVVKVTNKGSMQIELILTELPEKSGFRMTNKEIASKVNEVFGTPNKTTPECVAWYVSKLKDKTFRVKHDVDEDVYAEMKNLRANKS